MTGSIVVAVTRRIRGIAAKFMPMLFKKSQEQPLLPEKVVGAVDPDVEEEGTGGEFSAAVQALPPPLSEEMVVVLEAAAVDEEVTGDEFSTAVQNPGGFMGEISEIAARFIQKFFKKSQAAEAAAVMLVVVTVASIKDEGPGEEFSTGTPSPDPNISGPPPQNVPAEGTNPVQATSVEKQELGKLAFGIVAPTSIAIVITNTELSHTVLAHFVLAALSVGCTAFWFGVALKGTVTDQTSNIIEQLGIVLIFVPFFGLVASALPVEFAWVPLLCGCSFVLLLVIAVFPVNENTANGGASDLSNSIV